MIRAVGGIKAISIQTTKVPTEYTVNMKRQMVLLSLQSIRPTDRLTFMQVSQKVTQPEAMSILAAAETQLRPNVVAKSMVAITIITSQRTLMDNQKLIMQAMTTDARCVSLTDVPPQSAWSTFIGISEKPDHQVPFEDITLFHKTWMNLLALSNIAADNTLHINIGGDSTGCRIEMSSKTISNIWESGLTTEIKIEYAVLLPDRNHIIGITAEEGDEYWFFRRTL